MCSNRLCAGLLLVALAGCSIKEDRSNCGCQLRVAVFCPPGPQPVRLRLLDGPVLDVERDTVLVLAVKGPEAVLEAASGALPGADGTFRVAEGTAFPPLYLYSGRVATKEEAASVEVHLRKEYCLLHLHFTAPDGYGPPFGLRLVGEVAGSALDGTPLPGPFWVETSPDTEGRAAVRLPRQRDASLLLQLTYRDQVVRTFALGEYLQAAAYDWEAPSLEDMEVEIDIALTLLTIKILDSYHTEERFILV